MIAEVLLLLALVPAAAALLIANFAVSDEPQVASVRTRAVGTKDQG